jgi:hypothetical protein
MCFTDRVSRSLHYARWHPIVGQFRNLDKQWPYRGTEWDLNIRKYCSKLTHSIPRDAEKVSTPCARAVIAASVPNGRHHMRPLAAHCLREIWTIDVGQESRRGLS